MDRVARTDARRTSAVAVVVAFVAVLFAFSQLAHHDAAAHPEAHAGAAERLQSDIFRIRAAAEPVRDSTRAGTPLLLAETARFVDDVDAQGLPPRVRARMIDHAAASVVGVCAECLEVLRAARPVLAADPARPQERGFWARKMIGLSP